MKPLFKIGIVLAQAAIILVAFKAGGVIKARQMSAESWANTSQIPPGVALNPVPLKIGDDNTAIVLRGSYFVNALQHCNYCHTCPPYATGSDPVTPGVLPAVNAVNYMAGGRRFGPSNDTNAPISANLTPDLKTGLPGGMTFEQFRLVLRTGRAHKTGRNLQVMRWPMFGDLTDTDLMAIYAYLKAIPHAEPGRDPHNPQG